MAPLLSDAMQACTRRNLAGSRFFYNVLTLLVLVPDIADLERGAVDEIVCIQLGTHSGM